MSNVGPENVGVRSLPAYVQREEDRFKGGHTTLGAVSGAYYGFATEQRAEGNATGFRTALKRAVELSDSFAAGRQNLNPIEGEVRATILRDAGRMEEALSLIETGLLTEGVSTHVQALLLAGKAEILATREDTEEQVRDLMDAIAARLSRIEATNPRQAIRLHRSLIRLSRQRGESEQVQASAVKARRLIEEAGLDSQLKKLLYDLNA